MRFIHETLLSASPCTIANPFQAIKQTSFSRKAEAFTAENVGHAESSMCKRWCQIFIFGVSSLGTDTRRLIMTSSDTYPFPLELLQA